MPNLQEYRYGPTHPPHATPRHVMPTVTDLRQAASLLNEVALVLADGDGIVDQRTRARFGTNEKTIAVALAHVRRACLHGGGLGSLPAVIPSDIY